MKNTKDTIIKIKGKMPGPTLAIFGGVHGNELAGIKTIDFLKDNLQINSGTVYLVYGNPRAIREKKRFVESNLNRAFLKNIKAKTYEQKRAKNLISILDKCDALLDLHSYTEKEKPGILFAICEKNCLEIVKQLGVSFFLTNIDKVEKGGTDGHMFNEGKIGICVELGSHREYKKYTKVGIKTAHQFIQFFGLLDEKYEADNNKQIVLKASNIYKRKNKKFALTKKYSNIKVLTFLKQ
jgi:predicted deacylase